MMKKDKNKYFEYVVETDLAIYFKHEEVNGNRLYIKMFF
jgi:hypothetical protein